MTTANPDLHWTGHTVRAAIFALLFVIVLGFTTANSQHDVLGVGTNTATSYGWPWAWLHVRIFQDQITIYSDGHREGGGQRTEQSIERFPLLVAAGAAAVIAGVFSAPMFLLLDRKCRSRYEQVP